jgi:hypothetical protein
VKKLLGIIVLGLLLSANAYANVSSFEKWLYDNGHYELVEKTEKEICKSLDKGDPKYNTNLCHLNFYKNNLDIKINLKKYNLAYQANPNLDTLIYYLWKYSYKDRSYLKEFRSTNNSYNFKFNLIENKYLKKQMKTKGILSYLYYQDGEVLIDEFSPKERLGEFLNNETKFYSMSMSKSITSYILGHAICEGYIDGVDARIDDWPIIENTLYYNQKLINFLNMNTGDQKYINEFTHDHGKFLGNSKYSFEDKSISMSANRFLKGSVKSKNTYNYNGFVTQLILNYIKFKTGEDYKKLYSKIFNDKVKIKHSILFGRLNNVVEKNGNGHPNISATRFDYLRIAKAIMDDYQNNTCVGKYLKEIHKRRIPKRYNENKHEPEFNRTKSYGGQFHMDYPRLKNKIIFGMGGYGGNAILIDVENSRIVVLNSLHYNNGKYKYNVKKLLINPIKKGIN